MLRKLLTTIVLSLVVLTSSFTQDVDTSVLQLTGREWTQLDHGPKTFFVAGWLAGHTGLSFMLQNTDSLRSKYQTEEEWLLFNVTVDQLTFRIDMWYDTYEVPDMPVFVVMYIMTRKLTWDENDFNRVFGVNQILPGLM